MSGRSPTLPESLEESFIGSHGPKGLVGACCQARLKILLARREALPQEAARVTRVDMVLCFGRFKSRGGSFRWVGKSAG